MCPLAMPVLFLKCSVPSYINTSPPSVLVKFILLVPGPLVVAFSPDILLPPTKGLPLESLVTLTIVIVLPFASVTVN